MATDFDVTTYPLETSTSFKHGLGTRLDRTTDSGVRLRVLTTNKPVRINCIFTPQIEATSEAFLQYLYDNAATEFNIPHNGKTYTGFIDGESLDNTVSDGFINYWSFSFEGNAV